MDNSFKTIAEGWESYRRDVLPADASPIQVAETQLAFYGGASLAFALVTTLGQDDEPEAQGMARLQGWVKETVDFSASVLNRYMQRLAQFRREH